MPSIPSLKDCFGIDWLTCSFPIDSDGSHLRAVVKFCEMFLGAGDLVDRSGYGTRHRCHYAFGEGVGIYFSPAVDGEGYKRPDAALVLPGQGVGRFSPDDWAVFLGGLFGLRMTCTRIDISLDDYSWLITPWEIWETYRFLVTGPKPDRGFKDADPRHRGSCYFGKGGREGSGTQVNIYDKLIESGGEIDACRYEVRFFKEKADAAFRKLGELYGVDPFSETVVPVSSDQLGERLGSLFTGAIDFWALGTNMSDQHTARRARAPFWETIRGWLRPGDQAPIVV